MKNLPLILFLSCFFAPMLGAEENTLQEVLKEADHAFVSENYTKATELYESLVSENNYSTALLMRLTKAYYLKKDLARGEAAFLAAQRLEPRNHEVLEWGTFLRDNKKESRDSPAKTIFGPLWGSLFDGVGYLASSTWVMMGFLLGVFSLIIFTLIKMSRLPRSLISLGYFVCFLSVAFYGAYYLRDQMNPKIGIVTASEGEIYTGLGVQESIIAKIPQGTAVQIIEIEDGYYKVRMVDGSQRGWMKNAHVAYY